MMPFTLRDAAEADRDAIREATLSAYQEYEAMLRPQHWQLYLQDILATLAAVWPAEQIVAERQGKIVGGVLYYPADATIPTPDGRSATLICPEIRLLAVTPPARGQGIGRALVVECLRRAAAAGAAAITLHTTDMMAAAVRMYESMGFVRAPELDRQPVLEVLIKGYRFDLTAGDFTAASPAA